MPARRIELTPEQRQGLTANVSRGALSRMSPQREEQPRLGNALPCDYCGATGSVRLMGLPGRRDCPKCRGAGWVLLDEETEIRGT